MAVQICPCQPDIGLSVWSRVAATERPSFGAGENQVMFTCRKDGFQRTGLPVTHWPIAALANRPAAYGPWRVIVRQLAPGRHLLFGLENTAIWGRELARHLLDEGETVLEVAPIRTDWKRRQQPHPDKHDERDALAIAKALMNGLDGLPLTRSDDLLWTLSLLVTQREGLARERNPVKNRLHALLPHAYPEYRRFFGDPFRNTALAFWERYLSATFFTGICVVNLAESLREQSNYFSREKAAEILALAVTVGAGREHQATGMNWLAGIAGRERCGCRCGTREQSPPLRRPLLSLAPG